MKVMNNKTTAKYDKKRKIACTTITMITTFAVLVYLILPTNDMFSYVPITPEESEYKSEIDTDCFPDEIFTSGYPTNSHPLVLNGKFLNADTELDGSEVIEMDEIVVKGCEGGTKGEVPGKPGVCKE